MKSQIIKSIIFIILSASLTVLCSCAMQKDVLTLEDRLSHIEQGNAASEENSENFKSIIEEKDQNLRNQSAKLHVTLDELREDIQSLNGKLEDTEYLLKQRIKALEDSDPKQNNRLGRMNEMAGLNTDRIKYLEKYLDIDAPEPDLKIKAVSEANKKLSEDEIYAMAKQEFDQNNLETARKVFQSLLNQHPESQHADNAQFWIGESYYREKWYEKAIVEYQKVIEKYPKGNKVQASLLKQGLAFFNLEDKTNARLILKELVKKYPKSNEAKIATKKLEGL